MITVHVKLFATLCEKIKGYDPAKGIDLQLPQGATVADLKDHLSIMPEDTAVVAIQGKVARPEDPLADGAAIRILQLGHGG